MTMLLDISDLEKDDIYKIWSDINDRPDKNIEGNVAWSFEGNGIRTRTTFLQAFQRLGLSYVELPNFLKTGETVQDLAGYMDSFYSMYVIRDSNHQRMAAFAEASTRPVINAMSSEAHPCEVLTDGYYLNSKYKSLPELRILLWGPVTNVFKSWHSLSKVLSLNMTHFSPKEYHQETLGVTFTDNLTGQFDVVITDAWPADFPSGQYTLTEEILLELGSPVLLPTPPVTIGKELSFTPNSYERFAGYTQKASLLPVQEAIIYHILKS